MIELLTHYHYTFLFFGLLIGGESVLVPAVYLAITGVFTFPALIGVTIMATVISDSLWYAMGRWRLKKGMQKLQKIKEKNKGFETIEKHFYERPILYLFISKFVYGTRILAQVLSGISGLPYYKYIVVNIAAVLVWTGFLVGIGYTFSFGFHELDSFMKKVELFGLFIFITIGISVWIHHIFKKKWFQQ